jgi:hypothetical protein
MFQMEMKAHHYLQSTDHVRTRKNDSYKFWNNMFQMEMNALEHDPRCAPQWRAGRHHLEVDQFRIILHVLGLCGAIWHSSHVFHDAGGLG